MPLKERYVRPNWAHNPHEEKPPTELMQYAFEVEEVEGGKLIKDVPIFKLCKRTDPNGGRGDGP